MRNQIHFDQTFRKTKAWWRPLERYQGPQRVPALHGRSQCLHPEVLRRRLVWSHRLHGFWIPPGYYYINLIIVTKKIEFPALSSKELSSLTLTIFLCLLDYYYHFMETWGIAYSGGRLRINKVLLNKLTLFKTSWRKVLLHYFPLKSKYSYNGTFKWGTTCTFPSRCSKITGRQSSISFFGPETLTICNFAYSWGTWKLLPIWKPQPMLVFGIWTLNE